MELYSSEWADNHERLADAGIPVREGLYRICETAFRRLPQNAKILIVGCGTGVELIRLAKALPTATFVALDSAQPMLDFCVRQVEAKGLTHRVQFHSGAVDSLEHESPFDAATAILVSQHLANDAEAARFFTQISQRLKPSGCLYSADLHIPSDQNRDRMIDLWREQAVMSGVEASIIQNITARFGIDLRVRDEEAIAHLLHTAGLALSLKPFSSLLYGAWLSQKT
ncbi:MAG: class I SAM-dependent methyltransferase [Cyanobacteria bacterium J06642_2]